MPKQQYVIRLRTVDIAIYQQYVEYAQYEELKTEQFRVRREFDPVSKKQNKSKKPQPEASMLDKKIDSPLNCELANNKPFYRLLAFDVS